LILQCPCGVGGSVHWRLRLRSLNIVESKTSFQGHANFIEYFVDLRKSKTKRHSFNQLFLKKKDRKGRLECTPIVAYLVNVYY
jgi:hypothetical protein